MTMVEVLVASAVSAVVATGVATMASAGGRALDLGARRWADAAAATALVDRWPTGWMIESGAESGAGGQSGQVFAIWQRPDGTQVPVVGRRAHP